MPSDKKKVFTDGTLLFVSSLIVNAGNYVINLLFGRWLGPSDFSEVSLLVTLLLIISFVALGFQLTAAKYTASFEAENKSTQVFLLAEWLNKWATILGFSLMILMMSMAVIWQDLFKTTSFIPFIIFGFGLPLYLLMSVNRGLLQGKLAYRKLAVTYQVEMWVRVLLSIALVYAGFRVNGVAFGLTISLLATWCYSRVNFQRNNSNKEILNLVEIRHFLFMILLYECSQILINNSDILIVKHYFAPSDAGLYAALALVGRIVYFGTWTVVTLLFPIVIRLEKEGKKHTHYFFWSLAGVSAIAGSIVMGCFLFPDFLINILFGKAYLSIAPLLWKYALATALFACSNVFVYYHLSLDRLLPVWLTIAAGLTQIGFLLALHGNFSQVIAVQIKVMAVLFSALVIYQLLYKRLKM
jgi:O-antigen/teichoic acid export membrane protein